MLCPLKGLSASKVHQTVKGSSGFWLVKVHVEGSLWKSAALTASCLLGKVLLSHPASLFLSLQGRVFPLGSLCFRNLASALVIYG